MNNLELGSTKNYIDSLPPPEPIGPCTPFRAGGGNFSYYNNSLQGNDDVYNFSRDVAGSIGRHDLTLSA